MMLVAMMSQLLISCQAQTTAAGETPAYQGLRTGAEVLMAYEEIVDGETAVAVVGNQTSVVGNSHLIDTLIARDVSVTKIFCPEHGFRGTAAAGAHVSNSTDPKTGLPIISLYGTRSPRRSS